MDFIKYNRPKLPRNKYGIQNGVFYSGGSVFNSLGSGSASGSSVSLANYYTKPETDEIAATKLDKSIWDGVFRIDENGNLRCSTNFIGEKEVSAYGEGDTASSTVVVVDNLTSNLTDAALSANQGRVLKELIDTKTVDVDLTGYAKQEWVMQNFISVIPSEYVTDSELNNALSSYYTKTQIDNKGYLTAIPNEYITSTELETELGSYYTKTQIDNKGYLTSIPAEYVTDTELTSELGSYYTKTQIDNKGYLTAVPSEYVTETELNTELGSYYTKNDTDAKLDTKLNKSVWDGVFRIDENGDLRCTKNFIGEKEVSAYGAGDMASSTVVVVDNLNSNLTDAALSANQGRVLKELIDSKTVDVDLTGYAKQDWVSQNFISVIPSEYITETELNTALSSYYTKTQIDNKGYLTVIPSEYVTDTELSTSLNSYYTKTQIDNKGYLTAIPAEYVTDTELNTELGSYYTKAQIDNKGYLTVIPSEYVTDTELSTSLNSYYTKNDTDAKFNLKVDKTTWDSLFLIDSNGDLHVKTNLIGEKEVTAYNIGTEDPGVIVEGGSEWYNIHTKRLTSKTTTATDMYVVIENLDVDIVNNPDNYRIVLLTWKRKKGEGNRWRVPMFSPRWHADTGAIVSIGTPCSIAWNNTWWPITGNETKWWNTTNAKYTDVFDTTVNTLYVAFKNHNKKMRFGCCIMKKMVGVGAHGWQRVSNISEIMLFAIRGGKHFCMVK